MNSKVNTPSAAGVRTPGTKLLSQDDRGNPIRVLPLELLFEELADEKEQALDRALDDLSALQNSVQIRWWQGVIVIAPMLLFVLLVILWRELVLDNLGWFLIPAFAVPGLLLAPVLKRNCDRGVNRLPTRRLVEAGMCGQCCYSLEDIAEESDGCTVCPECGAAWRRDL